MESTLRKDGFRVFFYLRWPQNMDGIVRHFWSIPAKRPAFLPRHGKRRTRRFTSSLRIFFEGDKVQNPFNFVDRKRGFLFNREKAESKQAGEPVFRGEFQIGWKGYPLILTRQLTPQATKGRDGS
jgi:hypothetical protein